MFVEGTCGEREESEGEKSLGWMGNRMVKNHRSSSVMINSDSLNAYSRMIECSNKKLTLV